MDVDMLFRITPSTWAEYGVIWLRNKIRAKIYTQWVIWLNLNMSKPKWTDNTTGLKLNVRTVTEDGK